MASNDYSNEAVVYPAAFKKLIDSGQPGIPPNPTTDIPDKKLIGAMYLNFPYAHQTDSQKMDVYIPKGKGPFPVAVWVHGGGWMLMDKRIFVKEFGDTLLPLGFVVAALNFRGSNEAIFPAVIQDCKAAIRCLRGNAAKFNIDSNKIVIFGGSSGGHIAAMLGTSGGVKDTEDLSQGYADQSSRVNASIVMSGPIDFLQMDPQVARQTKEQGPGPHGPPMGPGGPGGPPRPGQPGPGGPPPNRLTDSDGSAESGLVGGRISKYPGRVKAANPMTYIKKDNPPFYIQYGKYDQIPYAQGVNLANALKAAIGEDKVVLIVSETAGHGSPAGVPEDMDAVMKFLKKHVLK
jgi:acetyl esterase/lipase